MTSMAADPEDAVNRRLQAEGQSASGRFKILASLVLAVPAAILLLAAMSEMIGGDLAGAQHLPEAGTLLALVAAGWRYPRLAGFLLIGVGSTLLVVWLVLVLRPGEPELSGAEIVAVVVTLFAPPLAAGWLFIRSGT